MLIQTQPVGLGYLEVDNRNVAADMPVGQRHFESDTYTCSHCQFVVILNSARTRERYRCRGCNHHICDNCEAARFAGAPCKTFAQVVDEGLERASRQPASLILP